MTEASVVSLWKMGATAPRTDTGCGTFVCVSPDGGQDRPVPFSQERQPWGVHTLIPNKAERTNIERPRGDARLGPSAGRVSLGRWDQSFCAGVPPAGLLGIDHSSRSLSPVLLRGNSFVLPPPTAPTPGNPASPLGGGAFILATPPPLLPLTHSLQVFPAAPRPRRPAGCADGPLMWAPSPSWAACLDNDSSGRPSSGHRRDLSRLRSLLGTAESHGLRRSCLRRSWALCRLKKNQKQNQYPANETHAPPRLRFASLQSTRLATCGPASGVSVRRSRSRPNRRGYF